MTVLETRAAALTITDLRIRVRDLTGDVDTNTANQRWSDAKIDRAISDMIAWMYVQLSIDPAVYSLSTTMTYTASAETTALPAETHSNGIIKVEDLDDTLSPHLMRRVSFQDLETFTDTTHAGWLVRPSFVWTLVGINIAVRPKPLVAKSLRIWYIANPWTIIGAAAPSTDQQPMSVAFEELLSLGAAVKLFRVDDEVPPQFLSDLAEMKDDFKIFAQRYLGPRRIRSRRRWR